MVIFVSESLTSLKVIHKTEKLVSHQQKMLTQVEMAATTGLGMTQFRKYLKKALIHIEKFRGQLLEDDEVIVQEVNGKPQYHRIVLSEIQKGIKNVHETRYSRAIKTRKLRRMGERCKSACKSAQS